MYVEENPLPPNHHPLFAPSSHVRTERIPSINEFGFLHSVGNDRGGFHGGSLGALFRLDGLSIRNALGLTGRVPELFWQVSCPITSMCIFFQRGLTFLPSVHLALSLRYPQSFTERFVLADPAHQLGLQPYILLHDVSHMLGPFGVASCSKFSMVSLSCAISSLRSSWLLGFTEEL